MTLIKIIDNQIAAFTDFVHKDKCKSVPGASWDKKLRAWTYPLSPIAAKNLVAAFGKDACEQCILDLADEYARVTTSLAAPEPPAIPKTKTPAWTHQRRAFWLMASLFGDVEAINNQS